MSEVILILSIMVPPVVILVLLLVLPSWHERRHCAVCNDRPVPTEPPIHLCDKHWWESQGLDRASL